MTNVEDMIFGVVKEKKAEVKDKSEKYFNENMIYEYKHKNNPSGILLNGMQLKNIMPKKAQTSLFSGEENVAFDDHIVTIFRKGEDDKKQTQTPEKKLLVRDLSEDEQKKLFKEAELAGVNAGLNHGVDKLKEKITQVEKKQEG